MEFDELRQRIEEILKKGKAGQARGPDLPFTSRAKKVLELAMSEATAIQHRYVGTEHFLLGLLAEEKGIAAQVLDSFDLTLDKTRAEVLRILGPEPDRRPAKAPEPPPGEKPADIRLILRYSNGAVVRREFSDTTDAANFLYRL